MIDNVEIPEGKIGAWSVERFEVPNGDVIGMIRYGARMPHAGWYTRLCRGDTVVMSDTTAEKRDHYAPVIKATGHCLVNGLGLGMIAKAMAKRPGVTKVTVIEQAPEVIALVAPYLKDDRIEVVQSCAFEYQPPKKIRYGAVWHDIWDFICADNLDGMRRLHRKYGRIADWQGSWARKECERQERENRREREIFELFSKARRMRRA